MDKTLERLHLALLEILDEIDRICRNNDISYFLDSGTALGAIRHGGFIPWDDDADVGMPRKDYEKFLKVAQTQLSNRFFLQTKETDPSFSKRSAKLRLNNTYFPEKRNEGISLHQGIFVDIFPFDYINDNKETAIKEIKRSRFLGGIYALQVRHPENEPIYRKIVRCLVRVIPSTWISTALYKHYTKYETHPTKTLVSYSYKMSDHMVLLFKYDDMLPTKDIPFEGRTYMIMKDTDSYLTIMYGDYMKLPPEEKRVWHFDGGIRFE